MEYRHIILGRRQNDNRWVGVSSLHKDEAQARFNKKALVISSVCLLLAFIYLLASYPIR